MASVVLSPELIYKPTSYRHGSKMFTRIVQQTGGTSVSIPVATTQESIFEVPVRAFYMGDSYIQGVATPTAGGAGFYNWFHKHTHYISELHLMTRGGTYISQLYNADRYRVATRGFHVKMEDFLAADDVDRFGPSRMSGVTPDVGGRVTSRAYPATAPYTEIQYAERGATMNSTTPVMSFTAKLSDYSDTIFALKKAHLLPEIVLLRVVWGPLNRFSWIGNDPTDATSGAAVPAGALTISNMYLHLATENDPVITDDLMKLQNAGYQMAIPWVYCNRQVTTAATALNITVKVTPDMGFMVKQLVYAPFNNTNSETLNTAQDHDNHTGGKIQSYQTTLDSVTRQQFLLSCGAAAGGATSGIYDDWKLQSRVCRGTESSPVISSNTTGFTWKISPISASGD